MVLFKGERLEFNSHSLTQTKKRGKKSDELISCDIIMCVSYDIPSTPILHLTMQRTHSCNLQKSVILQLFFCFLEEPDALKEKASNESNENKIRFEIITRRFQIIK